MLNDKYKIFVKQLVLNNDKLAKQLQDEEVLKNLTKNIEGTRIRKHLLNPTNYIFSREGQGLLYKGKVKEKIERMLSNVEVQMDFQDFIKNVSKTYRSLASIIIAEVCARKGPEQERLELISKIYNVDFTNAKEIIDNWKTHTLNLPILTGVEIICLY